MNSGQPLARCSRPSLDFSRVKVKMQWDLEDAEFLGVYSSSRPSKRPISL